MSKRVKKDPSTIGLSSSQTEGQGTTEREMAGNVSRSSSEKKQKKF
ncbi:MAG: YuzL family protein [Bacillales bacterium]|nr:YuzL family protein [Bacillales bacterium]